MEGWKAKEAKQRYSGGNHVVYHTSPKYPVSQRPRQANDRFKLNHSSDHWAYWIQETFELMYSRTATLSSPFQGQFKALFLDMQSRKQFQSHFGMRNK